MRIAQHGTVAWRAKRTWWTGGAIRPLKDLFMSAAAAGAPSATQLCVYAFLHADLSQVEQVAALLCDVPAAKGAGKAAFIFRLSLQAFCCF